MTIQGLTIDRLRQILNDAKIGFEEQSVREGYHMLQVAVPGQRWEIEVDVDGNVEFEVFRSKGEILGEHELLEAIGKFAEG